MEQCSAPPQEDTELTWRRRAPENDIFPLHCAKGELALKAKAYKLSLTTFG